jgi:hypothetical protein
MACSLQVAKSRRWSLPPKGSGLGECSERVFERFGHWHDAVEAGGVEKAIQARRCADDRNITFAFADTANRADKSTEAGRVHKRNLGQIDQQPAHTVYASERLSELANCVGVNLTGETAKVVSLALV